MSNVVRFYFSFRSPYAWLAFYRLHKIIDQLPASVEYIPAYHVFGSPVNDPAKNSRKLMYIGNDIKRFADAYGLNLNWPDNIDTDWKIPHNIFFYAMDNMLGPEYALKTYSARFEQGLDIGKEEVIKTVIRSVGLDPETAYAAAGDPLYQEQFEKYDVMKRKDKLFGVPYFVYKGNKYWGNDRLEWLIRDICQSNKMNVPDLLKDPFLRPF